MNARQAAEALFAPKPKRVEPVIQEAAPVIEEPVRTPRVLTIAAPAPVPRDEPVVPIHVPPSKEADIPTAHIARIRAWLKYGMTPAQVAKTYGVAVGEVERLLRPA